MLIDRVRRAEGGDDRLNLHREKPDAVRHHGVQKNNRQRGPARTTHVAPPDGLSSNAHDFAASMRRGSNASPRASAGPSRSAGTPLAAAGFA
jgi:hypothetical protein